jgi:hypothetical protein
MNSVMESRFWTQRLNNKMGHWNEFIRLHICNFQACVHSGLGSILGLKQAVMSEVFRVFL